VPEKYLEVIINAVKIVLLSNNSIARSIDCIAAQTKKRMLEKLANCAYFSFALEQVNEYSVSGTINLHCALH
jgi:ABC-type Co2+ transport system permease subunit